MNRVILVLIGGIVIGIVSTLGMVLLLQDNPSELNLSEDEKNEIREIIKKQCPNYPRSDAECASQWYTSILAEKKLGL